MGFTHYWSYLPESEQWQAAFPRLLADTRAILDHLTAHGIATAGAHGDGEPLLTASEIAFNGAAPRDYESFILDTTQDPNTRHRTHYGEPFTWDFCKTEHRPYDLAVTAILLRARQLAPWHFAIGSDGYWDSHWKPARDLIAALFEPFTENDPLTDTIDGPPILFAHNR